MKRKIILPIISLILSLISLLFILMSCANAGNYNMEMDCYIQTTINSSYVYRCENKEVICYIIEDDSENGIAASIDCKFKQK